MDRSSSSKTVRTALGLGFVTALIAAVPMGCLFPDFTFNEATGGTGGTVATGGLSGAAGTNTGPSAGGGGMTTTTTTTTTGGAGMGGAGGSGGTTTTGGAGTGGMGGTGGSTMTGSGGSTMTGGTGGTTTSMPPVEDCQNGIDDDGDGLIDCKDTVDCADYSCIPSIPAGWTGYFEVFQGLIANDPFCNEQFPTESYVGTYNLNAPASVCNACTCGAPQQMVCQPPALLKVLDAPCGGASVVERPLTMPAGWGACSSAIDGSGMGYYWPGGVTTCGGNQMQACNQSVTSDPPVVAGGFCSSAGGGGTTPPAKWDNYARACGDPVATGKGCNINQVCLPKPPSPYVGGLCIKKAGDVSCPASQFNTKHVFYTDFTDSRACSSCSCGSPAGATCAGTISTYSDNVFNACSALDVTFPAGGCGNLSGNPNAGNSKFVQTMGPTGGNCAPTGGMSIGQATPTFPTTFCCINN